MSRLVWAVLALASLSVGVAVALQPERSRDFLEVRRWFDAWQFGAVNPYDLAEHRINYPPHAFLLLSPFAAGAPATAAHVYAFVNAGLCLLAAWWTVVVVRSSVDRMSLGLVFVVAAMGMFRSAIWLGQTMPLAWILLMIGVHQRAERPLVAGVCLGLATFKPNLALPFMLLMILWRQWRVVITAGVTVASLTVAFAVMTAVPVTTVMTRYVATLVRASTETGYFRDALGLVTLTQLPALEALFYVLALATLAAICWLAAKGRITAIEALALVCLWATQAIGQQRFNIILAVPAVLLLLSSTRSVDRWIGWTAAVCLVIDPPLLARLAHWPDPSVPFWGSFACALLGWLIFRTRTQPPTTPRQGGAGARPPTWAIVGFLVGAVLQVGALALSGTNDVEIFKEWTLSSVKGGLVKSYTEPEPPRPPDTGPFARPDYPPLSVAVLFAAGQIALTGDPDLTVRSRLLTFLVKAPVLLARLAVLVLVVALSMKLVDAPNHAWTIGLVYWLNPALILMGPTLGYLDPLCWGPGLAALVFAGTNRPALAGAMLAASVLFKHQGAFFVLPVLACIHTRGDLTRVAVAFTAVAGIVAAPFLVYGDPVQFGRAMMINLSEDLLSGDALNLWWATTGMYQAAGNGWTALGAPIPHVELPAAAALLGFSPRLPAAATVIAASLWAFVRVRREPSVPAAAALGALSVHTYFIFAIAVHENHLAYSVPLAAIVMLYWREYWKIFVALSAMAAMNLALFYGLGRDFSTLANARYFPALTVLLSLGNILFLLMHWRTFLRQTHHSLLATRPT